MRGRGLAIVAVGAAVTAGAVSPPPEGGDHRSWLGTEAVGVGHDHRSHVRTVDHRALNPPVLRVPDHAGASGFRAVARSEEELCSADELAELSGRRRVEAIRSYSLQRHCLEQLKDPRPENRHRLYNNAFMVLVANVMAQHARIYQGDNSAGILQLILYLQAGYAVQSEHPGEVGAHDVRLRRAIRAALGAFSSNDRFHDVSSSHAVVLVEFVLLVDAARENVRYVSRLARFLAGFGRRHAQTDGMVDAVNAVFAVYYRMVTDDRLRNRYVDLLSENRKPVQALIRFSRKTWLVGGDAEEPLLNAAVELVRHLYLDDPVVRRLARTRTKEILADYGVEGDHKALWLKTAMAVSRYLESGESRQETCEDYGDGVCRIHDIVLEEALPTRHHCGEPVIAIRSKGLTAERLVDACHTFVRQEAEFHDVLKTNRVLVADDYNDKLNVRIFGSRAEYKEYGRFLYGIPTNNGGIYFEGDPIYPDNEAIFYTYVSRYYVSTLRHEYVHYLDGRFNLYGNSGHNVDYKTTWWQEGLAEYMSLGLGDTAAFELTGGDDSPTLGRIFAATYSGPLSLLYLGGYLAVHYLFEFRRDAVDTMLGYLRVGDRESYLDYLDELERLEETGFAEWVQDPRIDGYCVAGSNERRWRYYSYVSTVHMAGTSVSSGSGGYSVRDFPATLRSGSEPARHELIVTVDAESIYEYHLRLIAWFDWNDDKEFGEDEMIGREEFVWVADSPVDRTMDFAVPARVSGVRRLRIKLVVKRNFEIDAVARADALRGANADGGLASGMPRRSTGSGDVRGSDPGTEACGGGYYQKGEVEDYDVTFERG